MALTTATAKTAAPPPPGKRRGLAIGALILLLVVGAKMVATTLISQALTSEPARQLISDLANQALPPSAKHLVTQVPKPLHSSGGNSYQLPLVRLVRRNGGPALLELRNLDLTVSWWPGILKRRLYLRIGTADHSQGLQFRAAGSLPIAALRGSWPRSSAATDWSMDLENLPLGAALAGMTNDSGSLPFGLKPDCCTGRLDAHATIKMIGTKLTCGVKLNVYGASVQFAFLPTPITFPATTGELAITSVDQGLWDFTINDSINLVGRAVSLRFHKMNLAQPLTVTLSAKLPTALPIREALGCRWPPSATGLTARYDNGQWQC